MTNNNIKNNSVPITVEQTIAPIHQRTEASAIRSLDEPLPAYEISPSSNNNITAVVEEPPPPYCLVDPNKIRNMDHISPVEIIDLNVNNNNRHEQSSRYNNNHHQPVIAAGSVSDSNVDIGTDCTFLMAFVIAFFFNLFGFLGIVCLISTLAAHFGAMSGFGLSIVKWVTVIRYHEFINPSSREYGLAQHFVFAIVLFGGVLLFLRGLISYISVKNRANQNG